MPTSIQEGKSWLAERIIESDPSSVLDIGVGLGTYSRLLRPSLPSCIFIGIEIWEPYVAEYDLKSWYHELIIADVTSTPLPLADIIIMGDVLEHLTFRAAVGLWNRARRAGGSVFTSIPIVQCPQESYANPHEQHVQVWDHSMVLRELSGIEEYEVGDVIGVYRAPGIESSP